MSLLLTENVHQFLASMPCLLQDCEIILRKHLGSCLSDIDEGVINL